MDLKKTFDTVDHRILLQKLSKIGIGGKSLKRFESYLKGRPQRVKIDAVLSYIEEIICGVPPGSILGPLLFIIIYLNDINQLPLKGRIQLYADDAAIFYENSNQESLYQDITSDLELLSNWFSKNKLELCP